jgi:hypothetical protein
MRVASIGAKLEGNLGLRYMAAALEQKGHKAEIVPFNCGRPHLLSRKFRIAILTSQASHGFYWPSAPIL